MLKQQSGIGLIEVIVALVVLAIGVLGYVGMQTLAIKNSDDALSRTKAISLLAEAAGRIRNNSIATTDMATYRTNFTSTSIPAVTSCDTGCSSADIAKNDVNYIRNEAVKSDILVSMVACPGNASGVTRDCLIAAWGSTTATIADSGTTYCMNTNGIYRAATNTTRASQCVVLEVY